MDFTLYMLDVGKYTKEINIKRKLELLLKRTQFSEFCQETCRHSPEHPSAAIPCTKYAKIGQKNKVYTTENNIIF